MTDDRTCIRGLRAEGRALRHLLPFRPRLMRARSRAAGVRRNDAVTGHSSQLRFSSHARPARGCARLYGWLTAIADHLKANGAR